MKRLRRVLLLVFGPFYVLACSWLLAAWLPLALAFGLAQKAYRHFAKEVS
jgi:hypothetical protein